MKAKNLNRIKFDNKTIDKIKVEDLDFSYINKTGETKFRDRCRFTFEVPKKSILKGLKLWIRSGTGSKYFYLQFWFNSKPDYYSMYFL